jgi:hypothetical protein
MESGCGANKENILAAKAIPLKGASATGRPLGNLAPGAGLLRPAQESLINGITTTLS